MNKIKNIFLLVTCNVVGILLCAQEQSLDTLDTFTQTAVVLEKQEKISQTTQSTDAVITSSEQVSTQSIKSDEEDGQDTLAIKSPEIVDESITSTIETTQVPKKKKHHYDKKGLIDFDFDNEDLVSVVNKLAALEDMNIILPYGANAITQKVTLKLNKKISLEEADRYLDMFLELAGYSKVFRGDFYTIVKTDANVSRENLPLFIGVSPENLPNSGRIQVVYYFQNLKVPEMSQGTDAINSILTDMLSTNKSYVFDTKSNAVIISDRAPNIKAAMSVLLELDSMGIRDVLRQIRLYNASATTIANLLQSQIIAASGDQRNRIHFDIKSESGLYFAPGTKIIANPRTNSLIIVGKEPAVERIIEFIQEYLDTPSESGKSILHYYELQYLDSEQFAPVLKSVVSVQLSESGQATTEVSGPSRMFDGVIIAAEAFVEEKVEQNKLATGKETETALKGVVYKGGNRIVVAARERDWKRIEKLIRDLDKPQPQVIVQVLIIDFKSSNDKVFGMQMRNPSTIKLPEGVSFQTVHESPSPILPANFTSLPPDQKTLASDLLLLIAGTGNPPGPSYSIAKILTSDDPDLIKDYPTAENGSLIVSLADPNGSGVWSFLQWLNWFGYTKVLSHPYLVVLNNTKGESFSSTIRRDQGTAQVGEGGAQTIKQEDITASVKVSVVPHISSKERLNLQISISIDNFLSSGSATQSATSTNGNRATREMHTNVNLNSGQMLVLGGLSSEVNSEAIKETPLLGKIPIIGWLFSSKVAQKVKSNLSMFIVPTIVEPKIRIGMNKYTQDMINYTYHTTDSGALFDQLRDPVNYLFFKDDQNATMKALDKYLAESRGDFIRADKIRRRGPRCEFDKPMPVESQQLKTMLVGEQNPLLTASSKTTK